MKRFYLFQRLAFAVGASLIGPALALAAPFTPGNIVVARVGDGSATLSTTAVEVFLDEYTPSGRLVQSVGLPTSVSNTNRILTASGNATAELGMTRSADSHYLVLTGYGAAPGTTTVATSLASDVARVVGLIGADGSIDTSTSTGDAFSGGSIRTAATVDGTSFYSVGSNSGVRYQAFGSGVSTQLNTAPTNIRSINVAAGNLYISTSSSPYVGLSQVGTGLPTTAAQAVTALPGFPGTTLGSSSYGFYLTDLSADVPGVDVAYVADDRSAAGGIQKWSLVAGSWVLNGTITGTATAAVRGLDGTTNGATVSLVASSSTGLFVLADNDGYNTAPSIAALPTAIATAGTNKAFRGLAFAPVAAAPTIASFAPASGPVGTTVTVTGTNFTGATSLKLNGVAVSSFTVVDAATLTFAVPTGATSGAVAITTQGGTATSPGSFTVTTSAPTIASFTPTTGSAGTSVTITGTNFMGATAVSIGSLAMPTFTVVSATTIILVLPSTTSGATGAVTVVTPDGTATSTASFNLVLGTLASQALPGLSVFPNPATDYLTVELPQTGLGTATVALRDLMGRSVLAPTPLLGQQSLRLPASLAAGVYLLEVRQGSQTAVRRVEKK